MKINYYLLTIFWVQPNSKSKEQKQAPHNNRPKRLLLKASSYLSIGQYLLISRTWFIIIGLRTKWETTIKSKASFSNIQVFGLTRCPKGSTVYLFAHSDSISTNSKWDSYNPLKFNVKRSGSNEIYNLRDFRHLMRFIEIFLCTYVRKYWRYFWSWERL